MSLSRRGFVQLAGSSLLLRSQWLKAERSLRSGIPGVQVPAPGPMGTAKVALVHGEDRRKNVRTALETIDAEIRAGLRGKKSVLIKPNNVSTENQLAATHLDALEGILDYLEARFHGPVIIAESSAGDTLEGFKNFKYNQMAAERRAQKGKLVQMNREGKFETI